MTDSADARTVDATQATRTRLAHFDETLAARFDAGEPPLVLTRERAACMDALVLDAWARAGVNAEIALIAVGGYGRRSLYPQSDVDLLILVRPEERRPSADAIARFVALMWDARIPVSHAVRTEAEAVQACAEDITVLTALMDARVLAGDAARLVSLQAATAAAHMWSPSVYFEAKRTELRDRHARYDDTAENLEPNIKEGPGGLRDMQTLCWMSMRVLGHSGLKALEAHGQLGADEHDTLMRAAAQLQFLRFGLHLVAGKREERLRFDHQRALAARITGKDEASNADVERMMQAFYRSAGLVQRISERILQRFEEHLDGTPAPVPLDTSFEVRNGYLAASDADWPAQDVLRVFALFACWAKHPEIPALHSRTARALAEHLDAIPAWQDASMDARQAFLALFRGPSAIRMLVAMAKTGVLGKWIPAFSSVTGRMQFDLFHVYTVDQHTLMVLNTLATFEHAASAERFSLAAEVMPRLRKPELLLLAALFHDIAKGRGGDHSELGAVDARAFCTGLALSNEDAEMVEWLVRHHLLMSTTAQKQDISDVDVVARFAHAVTDRERLDYLYLLTCADIAGTSPKLWNAWKDRLLADLYTATRLALRRGLENPLAADTRIAETHAVAASLLQSAGDPQSLQAITVLDALPADALLRYRPEQVAWMAHSIAASMEGQVAARAVDDIGHALEIIVWSQDRAGLFAAIVMTLDRLGLEVLQARLLDASASHVLDTFHCMPRDSSRTVSPRDVEHRLKSVLAKPDLTGELPTRRAATRKLRQFRVVPQVAFTHVGHDQWLVSVVCNDRAGLLADIAAELRSSGMRVHDARIATFGERAEDLFVLSADNGRVLDEAERDALAERLKSILSGDVA